jgi:hypothetical protein
MLFFLTNIYHLDVLMLSQNLDQVGTKKANFTKEIFVIGKKSSGLTRTIVPTGSVQSNVAGTNFSHDHFYYYASQNWQTETAR